MKIENKEIKDMTCEEAKNILIKAYKERLLCIHSGGFKEEDVYDCIQALCMALKALNELKDKRISKETLKLIE